MDILKELKKILKYKNINKSINLTTNLKNDLGLDSLDLMELIVMIENKLNIQIPDDKLTDIITINDFIKIINNIKK